MFGHLVFGEGGDYHFEQLSMALEDILDVALVVDFLQIRDRV